MLPQNEVNQGREASELEEETGSVADTKREGHEAALPEEENDAVETKAAMGAVDPEVVVPVVAQNEASPAKTVAVDPPAGAIGSTDEPSRAPAANEPRSIRNLYVTVYSFNLFTITDGAIRLVVLLHAAALGFSPIQIAIMFTLYELAGVFTNLFGGIIGTRYGLKVSLFISLGTQVVGLVMLLLTTIIFPEVEDDNVSEEVRIRVTAWITFCQMMSGISKDFMKLACKSVPKLVTKEGADDALFHLVVMVTGWKNSFKGFGTVLGAVLVEFIGFEPAIGVLLGIIFVIAPVPMIWMDRDIGQGSKKTARFSWKAFQSTWNVNVLSSARVFLFGSRDVWFEIAAPIFIRGILGWPEFTVGLFMGAYTIIYGQLQTATGKVYKSKKKSKGTGGESNAAGTDDAEVATEQVRRCCKASFEGPPTEKHVPGWAYATTAFTLIWGIVLYPLYRKYADSGFTSSHWQWSIAGVLIAGLVIFACMFAVNSAVHSYLIVLYAEGNKLTMTVGTYYSANALGRLVGTILSGVIYQYTQEDFGISVCLWVAAVFMAIAGAVAIALRPHVSNKPAQV
ncbi:Hypothetical Protein FCC1311_091902 [Hondaea fermentalgiana]|uniref:Uncharacterized protein n=1 Tax=Hondaea fermentalgiana TaxID=2315210 RepID=A0A2R5GYA8_9STRA|nr:Hypothetical Protein FCC1311_091902 [Hondaea fermentalgiana]|eukprot:GBG32964.1 Hypothetical Protein FCC1311_091902 [Hondaea fermentalgiana]